MQSTTWALGSRMPLMHGGAHEGSSLLRSRCLITLSRGFKITALCGRPSSSLFHCTGLSAPGQQDHSTADVQLSPKEFTAQLEQRTGKVPAAHGKCSVPVERPCTQAETGYVSSMTDVCQQVQLLRKANHKKRRMRLSWLLR